MAEGKKVVAVCGATGVQGGGVVDALLRDGKYSIRALTRNVDSDKAAALKARGVEVVKADFDDVNSLKHALEDCYGGFFVTNYWEYLDVDKEIQQGKNLGDAAKAANLKHVVWSTLESAKEMDSAGKLPRLEGGWVVPHLDGKAAVTEYYKKIGLPVTALWTCFYTENFLTSFKPNKMPDGNLVIMMNMGDKPLPLMYTPDFGNVTAAVLNEGPEKWAGKVVGLASDCLPVAEYCAILSEVTGKTITYVPATDDQYRATMAQFVPQKVADDITNMFAFKREYTDQFAKSRDPAIARNLYPNITSFRQWAEDNRSALQAAVA